MKNILIVEDDFLARRLLMKTLKEHGFNIWEAQNESEALQIIHAQTIDVAILDINLGVDQNSGIAIGSIINNNKKIPFIYLTAYENQEIIKAALETEPYAYLTKPFKNTDLISTVELAIKNKKQNIETDQKLRVKEQDMYVEVALDDILFIESDGNYLLINTASKTYKYRSTVKDFIDKMPKSKFLQVHRAFIINPNKVDSFNLKQIVINNQYIPISKSFAEEIKELYNNFSLS